VYCAVISNAVDSNGVSARVQLPVPVKEMALMSAVAAVIPVKYKSRGVDCLRSDGSNTDGSGFEPCHCNQSDRWSNDETAH